nr:MAG TPA: hypothetical protein [Caudoviricetes sp.]
MKPTTAMISDCNRQIENAVTSGNGFRHIKYLVDARPCGTCTGSATQRK